MAGFNNTRSESVPLWPELTGRQKHEALAATWLPRLMEALLGAAVLAAMTAFASYQGAGGQLGWRVAFSTALSAGFLTAFLFLRDKKEPGPWIAPLGLATIVLTHLNLVTCVVKHLGGQERAAGAPEPVLMLVALIAGTLWALRVHLSLEGFAWAAALTTAILWMPWVLRTSSPLEFCLIGVGCAAAGLRMRAFGAERAYDVYRKDTLWPRLWRKRLDLAVARELASLDAATPAAPSISVDDRGAVSVFRLAAALAGGRSKSDLVEAHSREARTVDSQA